ncbi:MAG: transcriptional regulator, partial [Clostridiales bacterium]|nr:transcriptional regulator [Clostridiales bacterium]
PNSLRDGEKLTELQISFEIASEAPGFSAYYPSDIYFAINGTPLGFWTTPGEYNDRRGIFTPDWWFLNLGQYGKVKMLSVNSQGTFIDGFAISDVTVDRLNIRANAEISFVISSPKEAANHGGLTLFGKNFGDYNQGILVNMLYEKPTTEQTLPQ